MNETETLHQNGTQKKNLKYGALYPPKRSPSQLTSPCHYAYLRVANSQPEYHQVQTKIHREQNTRCQNVSKSQEYDAY